MRGHFATENLDVGEDFRRTFTSSITDHAFEAVFTRSRDPPAASDLLGAGSGQGSGPSSAAPGVPEMLAGVVHRHLVPLDGAGEARYHQCRDHRHSKGPTPMFARRFEFV